MSPKDCTRSDCFEGWPCANCLPVPTGRAYPILSLDGGGIRGVYTARLLHRLEQAHPGLLARVELCAGTSTGGLLAVGLAAGLTPADLERLYVERASDIFDKRVFGGVWGAKYSSDGLRAALEETFGSETKLKHLDKAVLVPSYDHEGQYIDGGVVANNPSACAAAQALHWGVPRSHLRVLQIGTGRAPSRSAAKFWESFEDRNARVVDVLLATTAAPTYFPGHPKDSAQEPRDWGLVRWATKIPSTFVDGDGDVATYLLRQVLGAAQAHRLDGVLPRDIALDDVGAIPELLEAADAVDLRPTLAWLKTAGWCG